MELSAILNQRIKNSVYMVRQKRGASACVLIIIVIIIADEGKLVHLTLGDILSFFTGAVKPPPLGFTPRPSLNFNNHDVYATASTCALELCLPTIYHGDFVTFKKKMITSFKHHGGFGKK